MKIEDRDYAVGKPYCILNSTWHNGELSSKNGIYHHPYGMVYIYQQGYNDTYEPFVMLKCIFGLNRIYYRWIRGKLYTDIGLARKAGEFIRQLIR